MSAVPNFYAVVLHRPARAIVSSFDFSHERTPSTVVWLVTKGKPHLATPALGPSLGVAPAGTWMWMWGGVHRKTIRNKMSGSMAGADIDHDAIRKVTILDSATRLCRADIGTLRI